MRQNNHDLFGVMLLASAVFLITWLEVEAVWLRTLLVLPLALWGVGYVLSAALFPLRQLRGAERFLLSLGLSISVLVLVALYLNSLPPGISPLALAWMLLVITTTAALLALMQRWRAGWRPGMLIDLRALGRWGRSQIANIPDRTVRPAMLVMLGLPLLLVLISLGLASRPAPQDNYQGYTMLWMVPFEFNDQAWVELGVQSMEFTSQAYRLELRSGEQLVAEWDGIQLAPKGDWAVHLSLENYEPGGEPLEAHLFRANRPGISYRQVRLWPGQLNELSELPNQPAAEGMP